MNYTDDGYLQEGIHEMSWEEFYAEFSFSAKRKELLTGLKEVINIFQSCGIPAIYVDGSFATKKIEPNDWDACFDCKEPKAMYLTQLSAKFPLTKHSLQKAAYKGEIYAAWTYADSKKTKLFIDFFQHDRHGNKKGIIKIKIA